MGQHGPGARPHLSGLTQMGKPSAPMRGGQASRTASGGEHGGAAQQKLNCLSSMYVGTFVALIPAFVFYYFVRRLELCFKAVSSITFPVRGSLFPWGNVWRPNIEFHILSTQHEIWPPRQFRMWACMPARALLSASRLRFGGCSCPVVGSGTSGICRASAALRPMRESSQLLRGSEMSTLSSEDHSSMDLVQCIEDINF
jgi:hypothetical protein